LVETKVIGTLKMSAYVSWRAFSKKIESLETDLQVKEKEIENQKMEIEELFDGQHNLKMKVEKLETELIEVKSAALAALSEVSSEFKCLKTQLEQERKKDREEISCIKSLLKTQKDSIIQDFTLEAEHMKKELVQEMENFKRKGLAPSEATLEVKLLRAELEQERKICKRTRSAIASGQPFESRIRRRGTKFQTNAIGTIENCCRNQTIQGRIKKRETKFPKNWNSAIKSCLGN